jgi:hypothetical protein
MIRKTEVREHLVAVNDRRGCLEECMICFLTLASRSPIAPFRLLPR